MSRAVTSLFLYNLNDASGDGDFEFHRFPRSINSADKANWEQLDVQGFVKPLSFANNDPQVIEIPEAWLDNTATGASVLPDVERLRRLMRRALGQDAPPALRFICGDWTADVVLVEVQAERVRFTGENVQTRVKLSLTFWEMGGAREASRAPGDRPEDAEFSF
jgi:hypothetical protein